MGLSLAVLLAQHNEVVALDIVPEKIDLLNKKQSPIVDAEIEDFLANKPLNFTATLDKEQAYKDAEFVVIATPTDYDFDPYTQKEDPRIFNFGNLMRKTRIDELPQLWNVLKGDMHLFGPRSEWNILVDNYEKDIPFYNERHLVAPGISGWAQVMYPYGSCVEDARQKLMYDLYYIKNWSVWLEIETLVRTVRVVLGKKGI